MPMTISGNHDGSVRLDSDDNTPFVVVGNAPRVAYVHKRGSIERLGVGHYGLGTKSYDDQMVGKARENYGVPITANNPRLAGTALTDGTQVGVIIHEEGDEYVLHVDGSEDGDWEFITVSKSAVGDEWVKYTDGLLGRLKERHSGHIP